MRDAALRIAEDLPAEPTADDLRDQEVEEARELLRWLADDHFTFLGYREYELATERRRAARRARHRPRHPARRPAPQRRRGHPVTPSFSRLPADARAKAREHKLLILTKANSRATVHRPSYLDYVGVKKFDADGQRRRRAPLPRPVLLRRVHRVRPPGPGPPAQGRRGPRGRGLPPTATTAGTCCRSWRRTRATSCSRPRSTSCAPSPPRVLYLQERRQLRLFLRQDDYGRYFSGLVYLPRDRYTTDVRLRMQRHPQGGTGRHQRRLHRLEHRVGARPAALRGPRRAGHRAAGADRRRRGALEARLAEAARSWDDDFAEALIAECGEERAAELLRRYGNAFPEGYKADLPPRAAVADLRQPGGAAGAADRGLRAQPLRAGRRRPRRAPVQDLPHRRAGLALRRAAGAPAARRGGRRRAPVRDAQRRTARTAWIYDFGLRDARGPAAATLGDDARERFQDAFAAAWTGQTENDGFNAPRPERRADLAAGDVLRAYAKYLRQAGSTFSQDYMEDTLRNNVHIARLLVDLFEARLAPERQRAGTELTDALAGGAGRRARRGRLASTRTGSCGRSWTVIKATLRTNYFQDAAAARPQAVRLVQVRPAGDPATCRRRGRSSRSGCTRRGSRACTCASARSPAAGCAGPTGARTSAPRSSAWSRRRW